MGWAHPDGAALRAAQVAEVGAVYGRPDSEPAGSEPSGADVTVFLVAYDGNKPLACGGLRLLPSGDAEVKRMYAVPAARGTGAATAVLRGLEDAARARGARTMRLETGDLLFAAQRFYLREGYSPIPAYGPYVGSDLSLCYARALC